MKRFGIFAVALVALSACKITVDDPNIQGGNLTVNTDLGDKVVTCSATLVSGTTAASGQATPIKVTAKGGTAPYQLLDTAVAFNTETVISRTYTNDTTANVTEVDTVVIKDSVGFVSQCNFLVTVTPSSSTPSTLACTLTAAPASPQVSSNILFTGAATGGTAPYTFSDLVLGTDSTVVSPLAPASSTSATATGKYNSVGLRTASVKVTDSTNTAVVCQRSVDVVAGPSISVLPSPAAAVAVGSQITLNVTPTGFTGTPTYTYTTSAAVTITPNGASAVITSSTVIAQFDVLVTATSGSQFASKTV
ncbi:hypothetical protein K2X33_11695, partial [bacterium]|nr:hypothetical protein [bacterium]